jgi:hypothetical protein
MEEAVQLLVVVSYDERIHRQHIRQRLGYRQLDPALSKSRDYALGGNVSNQRVLREGASTKPTDGRIDSPTPGIVSSEYFGRRFSGRTVKMDANIVIGILVGDRLYHTANQIRASNTDGVSH